MNNQLCKQQLKLQVHKNIETTLSQYVFDKSFRKIIHLAPQTALLKDPSNQRVIYFNGKMIKKRNKAKLLYAQEILEDKSRQYLVD